MIFLIAIFLSTYSLIREGRELEEEQEMEGIKEDRKEGKEGRREGGKRKERMGRRKGKMREEERKNFSLHFSTMQKLPHHAHHFHKE